MKSIRVFLASSAVVFSLLVPVITSAAVWQPIIPESCRGSGGCHTICELTQVVQNIINDAIILATFAAAILFAWAGMRMIAAQGNPQAITRAKEVFRNVFIGFVMILAAWLIVDSIMKAFYDEAKFGPWNQICTS